MIIIIKMVIITTAWFTKIEKNVSSPLQIEFQSIGFETFVDGDSEQMYHDCHGSTFADMDGDGILDLLISVGGGRGESVGIQFALRSKTKYTKPNINTKKRK